jgi:dipeptidyl aminopeptidase/acylaminoacyl peptidase
MDGRSMRRTVTYLLACALVAALGAQIATAARFGRNKVQYRSFDWKVVQTEHFDVYYYDGSEDLADAVQLIVEQANADFERVLGHELSTVIPVIVYASHNDFQQTNVTFSHVEETVGGFTELFKNRVVVPFTGSYADLRHVLYHELAHVFMFDIVYGGLVESVIRRAYMNPVPLWFTEGLAEYVSQGWDPEAEMILRDLTVSDRVVPLPYLYGGYLVYKEGQSVLNFIAERYGEEKIEEIVKGVAKTHNLERALKESIGLSTPELSDEWQTWLRERYWPEVGERERAEDIAKLLTDHRRTQSYLSIGPEISPDGRKVVFVSDRSGYADVYVASTLDGEVLAKLVSGERSDEFEALHILRTGFAWSPDGSEICFVAKAGASDALHFIDSETGRLRKSVRFELDGIFTPSWSPGGEHVVFVGTSRGASDLYVADPEGETLDRLTDDFYDERDPEWSPDGRRIAFASDRDSPQELGLRRSYDLYAIDTETLEVERLVKSPGTESSPTWSPDGNALMYASDRDGSSDLYLADLVSGRSVRLTRMIGGAEAPSWARGADRIVFSYYGNVGWDVATVKSPVDLLTEEAEVSDWFASIGPDVEEPVVAAGGAPEAVASGPAPRPDEPDGAASAAADAPVARSDAGVAEEGRSAPAEGGGRPVDKVRKAFLAATGDVPEPSEEDERRVPGSVEDYSPKFTPDWISGGLSYTSGYGIAGAAQIAVSDVLGNHRFYLATDFFSSIESSNFYVLYEHLAHRVNYAIGLYNFKEYYYSDRTQLGEDLGEKRYFTERSYGASVGLSYPFSRFSRLELDVSALQLDRQFAEENAVGDIELTDEQVSRSLLIPSLRLVNDTTLWGSVGPLSGGRSSIVVSRAWERGSDFGYLTAIADVRRYLRLGTRHSLAFKFVGARSTLSGAQNFYAGGVNSIRGYEDFEFRGHNLALVSLEFRYPFIDRLDIASPIPLSLWGLRGVMFVDAGAAWDDEFRGIEDDGGRRLKDIKASIGFGVRMRLAIFVIRLDRAWPTDLQDTGRAVTHFALGAEF